MRKGFTLIELIVSVSILSIGIVLVLRSFISASSALDTSQNHINAAQILEVKMNELELKAKEEDGIAPRNEQQITNINNREAICNLAIEPLETEELKEDLNEVKLSLEWREANINKDAILASYLKNKKE